MERGREGRRRLTSGRNPRAGPGPADRPSGRTKTRRAAGPRVGPPSTAGTVALMPGKPGRRGGGRGGRRPRSGGGWLPAQARALCRRNAGPDAGFERRASFLPSSFPRRSTDPLGRAAASTVPPRDRHGAATPRRRPPGARPLRTAPLIRPRPSATKPTPGPTAPPSYLDPLLVSPAFRHVGRSARFLLTWSEQGRGAGEVSRERGGSRPVM